MLSLFRRNLFINLIFLALFAVALLAYHLVLPNETSPLSTNSIFGDLLQLQNSTHLTKLLISLAFILIQAYLVNDLVIKHKLSRALSTIPGAVFILYTVWIMSEQVYHPALIANTFFVLSLNNLFKIYKRHQPIVLIFNSGLWLALAACFYTPYLLYLIVLLLGLLSLRSINLRETLQLLLGLLTPLFLMGTAFFYFDVIENFSQFQGNIGLPDFSQFSILGLIKPIILVLLIILSIFLSAEIKKKKKFDAIKKIELSYWIFLISILTIFFGHPLHEMHLLMVSIPMGLCYGLILETSTNKVVKEFMFLLAIGGYALFLIGFMG